MKINLTFICFLFFAQLGVGQVSDSVKKVVYTPEFRFRDGIYLNIDQVKKNQSISRAKIMCNIDINDISFYGKLFENKKLTYYDEQGLQRDLLMKDIWGFSQNGLLFINHNDDFSRIPVVGSICHFVSNKTTVNSSNRFNDLYASPYNSYNNNYYRQAPVSTTEQKQYILNFETGQILDFETEELQVFLMTDNQLLEEFGNLSNRKQRQMKFVFLRKFNEKHPLVLYIPNVD